MLVAAPNFFSAPSTILRLIRHVKRQQKFLATYLAPILQPYQQSSDGSLDAADFKKINTYYGLAVPAILGEALCIWRGQSMTLRERYALTLQGAMTGLFDDFFDKHDMPDEKLRTLIESPERLSPANKAEQLFLDLYTRALENVAERELVLHYLRRVHTAQVLSKKQAIEGALSSEQINHITIEKGGVSVLFYRAAMASQPDNREVHALYEMGGLMQLGNDIFDVYKDNLRGIETPMTTATHVNQVRDFFHAQCDKSFSACYEAGYPEKNTRDFLKLISMSLCARCEVCLDQLEDLEVRTDNIFQPDSYDRKDLVCDFENRKNTWRSIRYHMKHNTSKAALKNSQ